MRTICLAFVCLLFAYTGTTQDANLFFDFNKYELRPGEKEKLAEHIQQYKQFRFRFHLAGYADSVGANKYNFNLSKQRANAVKDYLIKQGIMEQDIVVEVFGETAKEQEDLLYNRRVSVSALKTGEKKLSSYREVIKSIAPARESQVILSGETSIIKGKKGTVVTIPANAFRTRNGKPVTGPVRVEMAEYYSMSDYISEGLTTMAGGELLVSGGVVDIRAYSDTIELFLKDSMQIQLAFPRSEKRQFNTFYGERLPDGTIDWKADDELWVGEVPGDSSEAMSLEETFADQLAQGNTSLVITYRQTPEGRKAVIYDRETKKFKLMTPELEAELKKQDEARQQEILKEMAEESKRYNELNSRRMSWINCDYYFRDPSTQDINLYVKITNPGMRIERAYVIFEDINSIIAIPGRKNGAQVKWRLPLKPAKLIVTSSAYGKIYCYYGNVELKSKTVETVSLKEISGEELSDLLKGI
jgi:hypothetical protein